MSGVLVACGCDVSASAISPSFKIMTEVLFLLFRVTLFFLFVTFSSLVIESYQTCLHLSLLSIRFSGCGGGGGGGPLHQGWVMSKRECCHEIHPCGVFAFICPNATHHTPSYTCPSRMLRYMDFLSKKYYF